MIRSVTVYCSSSNLAPEPFFNEADTLGRGLAERSIDLVFGGGHVGLMGRSADSALKAGGTVKGIIPRFLEEREVAHASLSELHVVETMHERKMLLTDWADAFVILPGGLGTLDELMEILTWKHLGRHAKPIILLNIDGFWEQLLRLFERIAEDRMVKPGYEEYYKVCNSADEALALIDQLNATCALTPS